MSPSAATPSSSATLDARLQAHLASHRLTRNDVIAQVDTSFGQPLLTVATGSVLAGFGNPGSDLDIYSVVSGAVAAALPLTAYVNAALIEVVLHGAEPITNRHRELVSGQWPPADIAPGAIASARLILDSLSRFALGLPLTGTQEWLSWQRKLAGDMPGRIAGWHAVEAVRKRVSARVFAPSKPIVAALRIGEALCAALERHAALHGEWYFKPKWLGEKLRRLDDHSALDAYRLAMCPPVIPSDVPAYLDKTGELLDHFLADVFCSGWRIKVTPAIGTQGHLFDETYLMSRWGLRTVAVPADGPACANPVWTYGIEDQWHDDVADLFIEDVLWMGVEKP